MTQLDNYTVKDVNTLRATIHELNLRLVASEVKLEVLLQERKDKKLFWAMVRNELAKMGYAIFGLSLGFALALHFVR